MRQFVWWVASTSPWFSRKEPNKLKCAVAHDSKYYICNKAYHLWQSQSVTMNFDPWPWKVELIGAPLRANPLPNLRIIHAASFEVIVLTPFILRWWAVVDRWRAASTWNNYILIQTRDKLSNHYHTNCISKDLDENQISYHSQWCCHL